MRFSPLRSTWAVPISIAPAMLQRFFAAIAVAVIGTSLSLYRMHRNLDNWTPDGSIYLRMTLQDRGLSERAALAKSNEFMRTTSEGHIGTRQEQLYTEHPPAYFRDQFVLFRTRPLYPAIAASLPLSAPQALRLVSALSCAVAPFLIYIILPKFAPPWIAALGALSVVTMPLIYSLAGSVLSDALALVFWVATLGALLTNARRCTTLNLIVLIVAASLLTLTRPAPYLAIAAALGLCAASSGIAERRRAAIAAVALFCVALAFALYTAAAHGPGISTQLRWEYEWQHTVRGPFSGGGFGSWWFLSAAHTLGDAPLQAYTHLGFFAIILAGFGAVLGRRSEILPVAIGSAAGTLVAILANLLDFTLDRMVTVPLTPVIAMLATLAMKALAQSVRDEHPAAGYPM